MVDDMNYVPWGNDFDVHTEYPVHQMQPSFGEYFTAQAGNVIRDSPTSSIYRYAELTKAGRHAFADPGGSGSIMSPDDAMLQPYKGDTEKFTYVSNEKARAILEEHGVKLDLGDGPISQEALDIMIDRALRRLRREQTIQAYDPSTASMLGISLLTSLADPANLAAGFMPVVGHARYTAMLAKAGSFGRRTGTRTVVGGIEGLGGAAAVEPFIFSAATQEGRDYNYMDSLANLAFGAGFGSGLHVAFGTGAEKILGRTFENAPPDHPADFVDRMAYDMRETTLRAAISDVISGRPVQAQDVIDFAARTDPELAKRVMYASTLRRDGPSIDDTDLRVAYWKGKLEGKRRDPATASAQDFMAWVREQGGVRDTDGVLEQALDAGLPRSALIKQKGLSRTDRGVAFDDLFKQAVEAGFVTTRDEFIDAFKAGQKGSPLRPILRQADEKQRAEADKILAEEKEYIQAMQEASGVDPNKSALTRARAIVGREQHVLAHERARIETAIKRLVARQEALARGETPEPLPEAPVSKQIQEERAAAQEAPEIPEEGDTVNLLDEEGAVLSLASGGADVVVSKVYSDPRYGTYVFFDPSAGLGDGGVAAGRVKIVKKAARTPEAPAPLAEAVAKDQAKLAKQVVDDKQARRLEQEAREDPKREIDERDVIRAIRMLLDDMGTDKSLPVKRIQDALGGAEVIGMRKLNALVNRIVKGRPDLRKGKIDGVNAIARQKVDEAEKLKMRLNKMEGQVSGKRMLLDHSFPTLAKQRTYYLSAFWNENSMFEMGEDNFRLWVNQAIQDKRLVLINEETGATLDKLDSAFFNDPAAPDVIMKFKDAAESARGGRELAKVLKTFYAPDAFPELRKKLEGVGDEAPPAPKAAKPAKQQPKLGPLSPEEQAQAVADFAKIGAARTEVPTPEAPVDALNASELAKATALYNQIEADTLRRLDAIMPLLPVEAQANIRTALSRVDKDANELVDILDTAILCLTAPPKG